MADLRRHTFPRDLALGFRGALASLVRKEPLVKIAIVAVPYANDIAKWGYAQGPDFFLRHGLVQALESHGHTVLPPAYAELPLRERGRDVVTNLGRLNRSESDLVAKALADPDTVVLALQGDCTHAPGVAGGIYRTRGGVGMVWYDAHGDINTMATTQTGLWGGMPYAVTLGWDLDDWREQAGLAAPIRPQAAALFGTSDLDPAEEQAIAREGLAHLDARDLSGEAVRRVLAPRRDAAPAWYLHIDMDVAGPEVPGVNTPAPYWPSREALIEAVAETARTVPVAAFSLAAINPLGDPEARSARLGRDLAVAIADAIAESR